MFIQKLGNGKNRTMKYFYQFFFPYGIKGQFLISSTAFWMHSVQYFFGGGGGGGGAGSFRKIKHFLYSILQYTTRNNHIFYCTLSMSLYHLRSGLTQQNWLNTMFSLIYLKVPHSVSKNNSFLQLHSLLFYQIKLNVSLRIQNNKNYVKHCI